MLRNAWPIAVALAWLVPGQAYAQDAAAEAGAEAGAGEETAPTAQEILLTAGEMLRPPGIRQRCPPSESGVIVVCAQDEEAQRVDSSTDQAIAAGQAVSDGVPRAPDQFGIPSGGVSIRLGSPPPPVLMIDLKAIPEAPAGSDAARYAEQAAAEAAAAESAE